MMRLHTEFESSGRMKLSRLIGKVTITANFKNANKAGSFTATINELKLNGIAATGSITFGENLNSRITMYTDFFETDSDTIRINGNKYNKGNYSIIFDRPTASNEPTQALGTINGITDDRTKSFVAAFDAKKE